MREFIRKAIKKSKIMSAVQLEDFVNLITEEYGLLDSVLNSINDGVIVAGFKNNIIIANRAAERILSCPLSETSEKPIWEQLKNNELSQFVELTIQKQATKTVKEFTLNFEDKIKYIEVSVLPFVKEKKVRGTIVLIADITEKRQEEIKARRLESLASLTNVAAAVAHEVKNPLAAISIHLQLLKKNFTSCNLDINQKAKKHITIIEEEIERLNDIVVDFLFAVRPLKLEFASVDINKILKNLYETFYEEFNNNGISISLNIEKELREVQGDERFLRQTFMNILVNAKAAMPEGGVIEIVTATKNNFVVVSISDSGQGIPEENLHKIFEPYFTTKHDGTGLGLTMAYKVIKEHGGDISVFSDYGIGTTFKFLIPIARTGNLLLLEDTTTPRKSILI